MRPKSEPKQPQRELFQIDLEKLIDMNHALVRLGQYIDWDGFAATLVGTYAVRHRATRPNGALVQVGKKL
jgi:hypothetical protein